MDALLRVVLTISCPPFAKFFYFPPVGVPSRPFPNAQPLQVAFPMLKRAALRSQKERVLGKEIACGGLRWRGRNKEKRAL